MAIVNSFSNEGLVLSVSEDSLERLIPPLLSGNGTRVLISGITACLVLFLA